MDIREFYLKGDIVDTLKSSKYHWFATGRFGLDLILNKPTENIDIFTVYVPEPEIQKFQSYLYSKGAKDNHDYPNSRLIPTSDYNTLLESLSDYKIDLKKSKNPSNIQSKFIESGSLDNKIYEKITGIEDCGFKEDELSYTDFLSKLDLEKTYSYLFSFDNKYPHVVSLKKLRNDAAIVSPRYFDNIWSEIWDRYRKWHDSPEREKKLKERQQETKSQDI